MKLLTSMLPRTTRQTGMTLVELLIVITIIGVLATIILSSVSTSRARAYDSKVKQQLWSFRSAAEIYFNSQNPVNYGPVVPVCNAGIFAEMSPDLGSPGIYIVATNLPTNTITVCGSSGSAYAVKASLYSSNQYWCVDSKGTARLVLGSIGTPVTACP